MMARSSASNPAETAGGKNSAAERPLISPAVYAA
jgi:hypothetical protein